MKAMKFDREGLFPVFYENGLLFKRMVNTYFLYKDNKLTILTEEELKDKDVHYPETVDELIALKNAIEFLYNRFLTSQRDSNEEEFFIMLKKIIYEIEKTNEEILYQKLKIKFEDKK